MQGFNLPFDISRIALDVADGKKPVNDLGKGIKKLHADYDKQLKNAKTKDRLRQVFQKHRRDHQNLLKKHLKQEEMTIKKLGKIIEQEKN